MSCQRVGRWEEIIGGGKEGSVSASASASVSASASASAWVHVHVHVHFRLRFHFYYRVKHFSPPSIIASVPNGPFIALASLLCHAKNLPAIIFPHADQECREGVTLSKDGANGGIAVVPFHRLQEGERR